MRLFYKGKDGGYESTVWGFWLCEFKSLFSIVLLCFENGSREAFHEHAFHSINWVLKGKLVEENLRELVGHRLTAPRWVVYFPSWRPIWTPRSRFHKVASEGRTWVLSFRGPWKKTWREYVPNTGLVTLTHGRRVVE